MDSKQIRTTKTWPNKNRGESGWLVRYPNAAKNNQEPACSFLSTSLSQPKQQHWILVQRL
jgi:hypothetical protein